MARVYTKAMGFRASRGRATPPEELDHTRETSPGAHKGIVSEAAIRGEGGKGRILGMGGRSYRLWKGRAPSCQRRSRRAERSTPSPSRKRTSPGSIPA